MNKLFISSEADPLKRVVVCPPHDEYFRVSDMQAHNIAEAADREETLRQHAQLVRTIAEFGAEVLSIGEMKDHPNSVFTRDTALLTPSGFIRLRMGISTRRGEELWMADFLEKEMVPCIGSVTSPGTAEGGDIILASDTAFIGLSSRTNEAGVEQVGKILIGLGYDVRVATVPHPFLHIGGAMSVVDNRTVLCVEGVFSSDYFAGFTTITVPKGDFIGGNIITLGKRKAIADTSSIQVVRALQTNAFSVHELDLGEFVKGTGGPSCLILPLARS